jgi:desulfoferrodoxin (superoxide reductase-like protein)
MLAQTKVERVENPDPVEEAPLMSNADERAQERANMKATLAAKKPTHIIEASLKEIGTTIDELKNDKVAARKKIVAFVAKLSTMSDLTVEQRKADADGKPILVASKVKALKVANITNVTVDGADGTVQIAIQTDEGDTKAEAVFCLNDNGQALSARAFCNLHGLWEGR